MGRGERYISTDDGPPHVRYISGSHRLEKYLNIQDCLEKSLKIKFALKST